ncbi:MAG: sulfite exporter TauE/SafE family protein [Desulfosarcina sp.]|nr:sulfite exporter TauE/SafE family protein [Desulfobacterales bacterium]
MGSFWLAFPMGVLIAAVVSAVGIGGGILWMPFLMLVLKMEPDASVITSLIIQTAGMGSSSLAYARRALVDFKLTGILLAVTVPGIAIGACMMRNIRPAHIELALGLLTMMTAFLFVSSNQKYDQRGHRHITLRAARPYMGWISLMSVASGMLSVSIGEWLVPILRGKLALRMRAAVATSIATIFGTCILGAAFHYVLGSTPHWSTVAWAVPGVLIGGQIGPRLAERINERMLKEVFIFLLTLIGIHLIYNAF